MPSVHLTEVTLKNLKAPLEGQITYTDESLPGFGIRVSQGGVKAFVLVHGRSRQRTTIGRYPAVTLAQARARAKEILAERTLGKHQAPTLSFSEVLDLYTEHHIDKKLRASTSREIKRTLKKHFLPKLKHEKLADITTASLMGIVDKIEAPSVAAHSYTYILGLFRWATRRRYLVHNPLEGTDSPAKSVARDRVLTDQELTTIFTHIRTKPGTFNRLVELLLITGQRRNQIVLLNAAFIDYEEKSITWPAALMKGNREHRIPYGDMTAAILETLPKEGLLFPAKGKPDKPFNGFSKAKPDFDAALTKANKSEPLTHWTLHDLRRTLASSWQAMGVRIEVTEKYLAHSSGSLAGIVGVYQRHNYMPEMREAVKDWEAHLQSLLNLE